MPGQLNLFRSRRQRGQVHLPGPTEFQLHCMVADTVTRWRMPGWMIWTQNHSIARRWQGIHFRSKCEHGLGLAPIEDANNLVGELRLRKTDEEVELMRADQFGGDAGRGHRTNREVARHVADVGF